MSTQRFLYNPPLTTALVATNLFQAQPFSLVDVGASGGIHGNWKVFIPYLRAIGFDPLIAEVERLNLESPSPMIRYEAAYVGYQSQDKTLNSNKGIERINPIFRSSMFRGRRVSNFDYTKNVYNQGEEVKLTDRFIELDTFFSDLEKDEINFIKTDIDGYDYQALLGARDILRRGNLLGLSVEADFHGMGAHEASSFANIDRLLRDCGFFLFDIEIHRYSRADLPRPFEYELLGSTVDGQVMWGDAIYFRDFGNPDYEKDWLLEPTDTLLLKLICLFELFGLQDCAVEVLLKYKDRLRNLIDIDASLNALVPEWQGKQLSFSEFNQEFDAYVKRTFANPSATLETELEIAQASKKPLAYWSPPAQAFEQFQKDFQQIQTALQQAEARAQVAEERIQSMELELQSSKERIKAMESSKFWRMRQQWFQFKQAVGLAKKIA
ncbi:MAG: FkbM family methyltransferase [Kovacikia sp.]